MWNVPSILRTASFTLLAFRAAAAAAALDPPFPERCASFAPKDVAGATRIDSVRLETSDDRSYQSCAVHGSIVSSPTSTIHFRVDLPPPASWNAKLMMVGGGGFDGFIPT